MLLEHYRTQERSLPAEALEENGYIRGNADNECDGEVVWKRATHQDDKLSAFGVFDRMNNDHRGKCICEALLDLACIVLKKPHEQHEFMKTTRATLPVEGLRDLVTVIGLPAGTVMKTRKALTQNLHDALGSRNGVTPRGWADGVRMNLCKNQFECGAANFKNQFGGMAGYLQWSYEQVRSAFEGGHEVDTSMERESCTFAARALLPLLTTVPGLRGPTNNPALPFLLVTFCA